jgi:hypothetical protein
MSKPLKEIIGVKKSTVKPGSIGKDPGVDYAPKAPNEQEFVKKHEIEKHEDRAGNGDDVFQATNVKYSLEKEEKHGHVPPKDKKVNESTIQKFKKKVNEINAPRDGGISLPPLPSKPPTNTRPGFSADNPYGKI